MLVLRYKTGEEIKKDDPVVYHGSQGGVERVRLNPRDPEQDWYVLEYGGDMDCDGVFGRVFIAAGDTDEFEDLAFIARAGEPAPS